jgi:hypothetical protein
MKKEYSRYSIVDIAEVIDNAMRGYVESNPDDHSGYSNACNAGLMAAMKLSRGIFNPQIVQSMCHLNSDVFNDTKYSIPT